MAKKNSMDKKDYSNLGADDLQRIADCFKIGKILEWSRLEYREYKVSTNQGDFLISSYPYNEYRDDDFVIEFLFNGQVGEVLDTGEYAYDKQIIKYTHKFDTYWYCLNVK